MRCDKYRKSNNLLLPMMCDNCGYVHVPEVLVNKCNKCGKDSTEIKDVEEIVKYLKMASLKSGRVYTCTCTPGTVTIIDKK